MKPDTDGCAQAPGRREISGNVDNLLENLQRLWGTLAGALEGLSHWQPEQSLNLGVYEIRCPDCAGHAAKLNGTRQRIAILEMLKTAFEGIKSSLESARTFLEAEAATITGKLFNTQSMTPEEIEKLQEDGRRVHEQRQAVEATLPVIEGSLDDIQDALDEANRKLQQQQRELEECEEEQCM